MNAAKLNRLVHYWLSLAIFLPVAVILGSGLMLVLKKDVDWIQPPTLRGATSDLSISFDDILVAAMTAPEAGFRGWDDVDRLDVRPNKGVVKVRGKNGWEVQIDTASGDLLGTARRRSDTIEAIHDGSFFGDPVKYWVVLPTGLFLVVMWGTGVYLFVLPYIQKRRNRLRREARMAASA